MKYYFPALETELSTTTAQFFSAFSKSLMQNIIIICYMSSGYHMFTDNSSFQVLVMYYILGKLC